MPQHAQHASTALALKLSTGNLSTANLRWRWSILRWAALALGCAEAGWRWRCAALGKRCAELRWRWAALALTLAALALALTALALGCAGAGWRWGPLRWAALALSCAGIPAQVAMPTSATQIS